MKKLLLIILSVTTLSVNAQYLTTNAKNIDCREVSGVYYYLPRNTVKIQFTIQETRTFIGPFAEYATTLLGTNDYIREDKKEVEIKNVCVEILSEADPNAVFFVYNDEKSREQGSFNFSFDEKGVISGFGIDNVLENTGKDDILLYDDVVVETPEVKFIDFIAESNEDDDEDEGAPKKLTKEDKAKSVIERIGKIRSAYFDLISGFQEVNYGSAMNDMQAKLKELEYEYLCLFKGKKSVMTYQKTVYITPDKNMLGNESVIAKIVDNEGFITSNVKGGEGVRLSFVADNMSKQIKEISRDDIETGVFSNKLFYRVPEQVKMKLTYKNKTIFESDMRINQFGDYVLVPINNYKLVFDTDNGCMRSISK
ncbi:MAG: DUF4831 family protein [Candidatus Limimorpha sp.]